MRQGQAVPASPRQASLTAGNVIAFVLSKKKRQKNSPEGGSNGSHSQAKSASAVRRRRVGGKKRGDRGNPCDLARARLCPGRNSALAALERLHSRLRRASEEGNRAGGRKGARHQAHH